MAGKYSFAEKVRRTLVLLMGLEHPRVLEQLAPYGLGPEDREEGQRLVLEAIRLRTSARDLPAPNTRLAELRAFESRWLKLSKIKLRRTHPEFVERLLPSRQLAKEVVFTVARFVDALAEMEAGRAPWGERGRQARESLRELGVSDAVVAEGRALLTALTEAVPAESGPAASAGERDAAEAAMWAWYLEWSAVSRRVITRAELRRLLGLGRPAGRPKGKTKTRASGRPVAA